jgi:uncharacterized membrane protein
MDKRTIIAITLAVVISVALVIAPWVYQFHGVSFSGDPANWGVFGDYLGGVLSTIVSILGFIAVIVTIKIQSRGITAQLSSIQQEKEIRDDEVYTKQALECLTEALSMLTDRTTGGLVGDRIAWIESARYIATAQNLSKNIKSKSVILVYKTAEKLIRSKFSIRLDLRLSPETTQPSYFRAPDWSEYVQDRNSEGFDRYSVYVIYKFASWQQDEDDVLNLTTEEIDPSMINRRFFGARLFFEELEARQRQD